MDRYFPSPAGAESSVNYACWPPILSIKSGKQGIGSASITDAIGCSDSVLHKRSGYRHLAIVVCEGAIEQGFAVDFIVVLYGILDVFAQQVENTILAVAHIAHKLNPLEHVGIFAQVGNVASELGKRITEEIAVRVDNRRPDRSVAVLHEKEKVRVQGHAPHR